MERVGFKCVGSCEIDKYARIIYAKHWEEPEFGDVTKVDAKEIPDHDILCGGFPCQAFSVAGKRLGFEDTRGTLFFEIGRIAREKRPRLLFLENVKGLLFHDRGKTFATILATLDELGYDAEWQVLNSKYFVPQNRERVFIIGHLRGEPTRKIFPIGASCKEYDGTLEKAQAKKTWVRSPLSRSLDANYAKGAGSRTMILHSDSETQTYRIYNPEGISPTIDTRQNHSLRVILLAEDCTKTPSGRSRMTDHIYDSTGLHPTLDCKTIKVKFTDKDKIRQLTPLECERLQGFPDGWTEGISDTQRYKCLGNAVTVPVIEYIARAIKEQLTE